MFSHNTKACRDTLILSQTTDKIGKEFYCKAQAVNNVLMSFLFLLRFFFVRVLHFILIGFLFSLFIVCNLAIHKLLNFPLAKVGRLQSRQSDRPP